MFIKVTIGMVVEVLLLIKLLDIRMSYSVKMLRISIKIDDFLNNFEELDDFDNFGDFYNIALVTLMIFSLKIFYILGVK